MRPRRANRGAASSLCYTEQTFGKERRTTIPAAYSWPTNGHLIADVARLYDFGETVLDATYGRGLFWTEYQPPVLITNDLDLDTEATHHHDFQNLPWGDAEFDTVVFDPPYKLNGTPALGDFDNRYGIGQPTRWQQRIASMLEGALECGRVARNLLLVKCQDQVVSGKIRWQTLMVTNDLGSVGWELEDRFDLLGGGRTQPSGRRQVHAHGRPSTLLVFKRNSRGRRST